MNRTRDELYTLGHKDGFEGRDAFPPKGDPAAEWYMQGYRDGVGDAALNVVVEIEQAAARPVDDLYYELNDPPAGFVWTGEKRTPVPGDYYLSKNGNAIKCEKVRGNNQKRHILKPSFRMKDVFFLGYILGWDKRPHGMDEDPIFMQGYCAGRDDKQAWGNRSSNGFGPGGKDVGCHFGIAYAHGYVGTVQVGNSPEWYAVYHVGEADRKRDEELIFLAEFLDKLRST